jgi:hypothetical protein
MHAGVDIYRLYSMVACIGIHGIEFYTGHKSTGGAALRSAMTSRPDALSRYSRMFG